MKMTSRLTMQAIVLGLGTMVAAYSHADVLNLNFSAVSPDGVTVANSVINPAVNVPAATSSAHYGNTLASLSYAIPGSVSGSAPTGFEFYDDYVFTIGGSSVSSITATIDLGNLLSIDDLNVRLFSWNGTAEQLNSTVTIGSTAPNTIQAWTYAIGSGGDVAVINQTGLAAGTYVLQVRGNVSGSSGGSYAGTLNVAPVPLPAGLPLLVSGLGLLSGAIRRRLNA